METAAYLFVGFAGGALILELLRYNAVMSMRNEFRFYFKELISCVRWAQPSKILRDPEFKAFYMQVMHPYRKFNFKQLLKLASVKK